MKKGQKVKFSMYDSLFKDYIKATGILLHNVFGKLWLVKPDINERLLGGDMVIHESWINGK